VVVVAAAAAVVVAAAAAVVVAAAVGVDATGSFCVYILSLTRGALRRT
jgi:hypothetical protein